MKLTTNLSLKKPDYSDPVDIKDINDNMDAIDVAIQSKSLKTTQIIAGNGLSGGGALDGNRTLSLGTPMTISNATTNTVTATGHTHALTVPPNPTLESLGAAAISHTHTIEDIGIARGSSTFAGGSGEKTIGHGLGITPSYASAMPSVATSGTVGEIWVRMDATNIYVGNTGSFMGAFSWIAVK